MKNQIKIVLAGMVMAGFFFSALRTEAYPPFVRKSEKFGAKDCLFCHTQAGGGEGWNERGSWLIAEKDKRKADSIDVEWLADYKPEETKKEGDPKEGEKKPAEKPPAAASAPDHSAHKSAEAAAKSATPAATGAVDHSSHNHSEAAAKPAASATTSETTTTEKTVKVSKKPKSKLKKK